MKRIFKLLTIMMISLLVIACGEKKESGKIKVTTTLNYYTNLIEEIGGDKVEVTGLMKEGEDLAGDKVDMELIIPAGEDPHLYVATAGDVDKLQNADLVVYGGLHLEGKMTEIFDNLSNKYILNLGEQLDKSLLHKENENTYDPHVWFNTQFWAIQAKAVKDKLAEISPENKEYFENNDYKVIETIGDTGKGIDELKRYLESLQKGVNTTKTIIIGIPNVGKSTIINKLLGKNSLEAKNKAGVTKKLKWVRVNDKISIIDSPGMLWPKFEDTKIGNNLAAVRQYKR